MNNDRQFKRENKPSACTLPPWAIFIPAKERAEILRTIRQECIDVYGHSYDECSKRKICITKSCLGRPLPWESPTAIPYLNELLKSHEVNIDKELVIKTDCSSCPIYKTCNTLCNQVTDYIDRNKSVESIVYLSEDIASNTGIFKTKKYKSDSTKLKFTLKDLPWDSLTDREQQIVKCYFIEQRDYRHIADKYGFYNQAASKYFIYVKLNKLSKTAAMRLFIKSNRNSLNIKTLTLLEELYINNKSQKQVAKELGYYDSDLSVELKRIKDKYKIKWKVFVKRTKGKTCYYPLEVLR